MQLDITIKDEDCYSIEFENGEVIFSHHSYAEGHGAVGLTIEEMEKVLELAKAQRDHERQAARDRKAAEKAERKAKEERRRLRSERRSNGSSS